MTSKIFIPNRIKHIVLLLACFTFSAGTTVATNLDSLIRVAPHAKGTEAVKIYAQLCWELKYKDQNASIEYGLKGLEISNKLDNDRHRAELLKSLGAVYLIKTEYNQSQTYVNEARLIFQRLNSLTDLASVDNLLGLIESNKGNFQEAIVSFESAIALYKAVADTAKIMAVEANIGNVHFSQGQYQNALPYYLRIIDYARKTNDRNTLATNTYNAGMVYTTLGKYPKALEHLFEASRLDKETENHYHWIKAQNEIGLLYRRLGLLDEAISLYKPILEKARQLDNTNLIASILNNLGLCHFHKDHLDEAMGHFRESLEMKQSVNISNVGHVLNNIGRVHQKKGKNDLAFKYFNQALETDSRLGIENKVAIDLLALGNHHLNLEEYDIAKPHLTEAHTIFTKLNELKSLTHTTESLMHLYEKTNENSERVRFEKLNKFYLDSLNSLENMMNASRIIIRENLNEISSQGDSSIQASTLDEKENDNHNYNAYSKALIVGAAILIILLITLAFWKYFKSNSGNLSKKLAQVESEKAQLQHSIQEQNRELVFFSLSLIQKENLMKTFKTRLTEILSSQKENTQLRKLINEIDINNLETKDWSFFNSAFNKTFPGFTQKVRQSYSNLSSKELQHCILIKLNTTPSQVANILGINTESVHTARYRLKKKMNLSKESNLERVIHSI